MFFNVSRETLKTWEGLGMRLNKVSTRIMIYCKSGILMLCNFRGLNFRLQNFVGTTPYHTLALIVDMHFYKINFVPS